MKKVRMIVSAVAVFAVVGGALAFKTPNLNAFACDDATNKCVLSRQTVNPAGSTLHLAKGAITTANIAGQTCTSICDQPITFSVE